MAGPQLRPPPSPLRVATTRLARSLPGLAPAFLIVAVLACVLVPLPTQLVDLLLSVSLAGAVLLVVVSLGIRRTTDFLGFPSLLLLVTLYRLALNVSTTRLILSQADAGRVIDAFAEFVIRDDLVVGGVMFAIITVVQYVVVARGAERVAEVAARFALDGLPGHQAAIDADLRAGVISAHEASRRRGLLTERSSFYGAMDGAVRFVKGDAIAGLAITGINLVGGLVIGVGRQDMSWATALDTYARLTVGDGLLAQIPALLVSLAAGVLVSRVDADEGRGSVFRTGWLEPGMLLVPAAMLLGLATIPSMPRLAFLATGVAFASGAIALALRPSARRRTRAKTGRLVTVAASPTDIEDPRTIERALAEVRLQCATVLGIDVPPIVLDLDAFAEPGRAIVCLDGRRIGTADVTRGRAGEDAVVLASFRAVMDAAPQLVDLQDLDRMLEELRASHPVVVRRALENVDLTDILAVVRGFLRERIPLPELAALVGVLAESRRFADPDERRNAPERVRTRLAGHWVHPVLDALRRARATAFVRLTPDAEAELLDHWTVGTDGGALALSPRARAEWIAAARDRAGSQPDDGPPTALVLVATPAARPAVAALVAGATPHVVVLSTVELAVAERAPDVGWLDAP